MKKTALILLLAFTSWACDTQCATGSICGDHNVVGPGGLPSPSPIPLPGATPDPCLIKGINVSFMSGVQMPFLPLGETHQLDATPMNDQGEVPKGCNLSRDPVWVVHTPQTCQVLNSGYNPFVRGLKVGLCSVAASIGNVSSTPFTVEVR